MLKSIIFTFSSPICGCLKNNVRWGWHSQFYLECQTCKTVWAMPATDTKAAIIFEKPYPEGNAEKDNIHTLRIIK